MQIKYSLKLLCLLLFTLSLPPFLKAQHLSYFGQPIIRTSYNHVIIKDTLIFAFGKKALEVFSVAQNKSAIFLKSFNILGSDPIIYKSKIYCFYANKIKVLDISDPLNTTTIGINSYKGYLNKALIFNDFLYLATKGNLLQVFDLKKQNPELAYEGIDSLIDNLSIRNNQLVVCKGADVRLYSLNNGIPIFSESTIFPDYSSTVLVSRNLAFVEEIKPFGRELSMYSYKIFDIKDFKNPILKKVLAYSPLSSRSEFKAIQLNDSMLILSLNYSSQSYLIFNLDTEETFYTYKISPYSPSSGAFFTEPDLLALNDGIEGFTILKVGPNSFDTLAILNKNYGDFTNLAVSNNKIYVTDSKNNLIGFEPDDTSRTETKPLNFKFSGNISISGNFLSETYNFGNSFNLYYNNSGKSFDFVKSYLYANTPVFNSNTMYYYVYGNAVLAADDISDPFNPKEIFGLKDSLWMNYDYFFPHINIFAKKCYTKDSICIQLFKIQNSLPVLFKTIKDPGYFSLYYDYSYDSSSNRIYVYDQYPYFLDITDPENILKSDYFSAKLGQTYKNLEFRVVDNNLLLHYIDLRAHYFLQSIPLGELPLKNLFIYNDYLYLLYDNFIDTYKLSNIPIGIKTVRQIEKTKSTIFVFPNPGKGEINIGMSTDSFIKITDLNGRLIFSDFFAKGTTRLNPGLNTGIYFLISESEKGKSVTKLIVNPD